MTDARVRADRFGRRAETIAAWLLRLEGYRILARRYRTPLGEIDLIARRGDDLVVVEVKARARLEAALEALSAGQRRRLERAALHFLADRRLVGDAAAADLRFDLIAIAPWRLPRHLVGAWRPGE